MNMPLATKLQLESWAYDMYMKKKRNNKNRWTQNIPKYMTFISIRKY